MSRTKLPRHSFGASHESLGDMARRPPRKPLRTLKELAEEFGLPMRNLAACMGRDKDSPKPLFSTGGHPSASPRNTWYDPAEVRRWWRARTEAMQTTQVKDESERRVDRNIDDVDEVLR